MILGLSVAAYTLLHVIISLIAILSGFVVLFGMLGAHRLPGWTALFLVTTVLTSVGGLLFPIHGFTPAIGTGAVSLLILAAALVALYARHLAGAWRWIYVVAAVAALYFNVLVLIVQSFEKVTLLNPSAPVVGPPFAGPVNTHFVVTQAAALLLFIVLGSLAVIRFRPASVR